MVNTQHTTVSNSIKENWIEFIHQLQDKICAALEQVDGKEKFIEDEWQRTEGKGGGGLTKVIQNGNVFEKGGVNTSVVYGEVTDAMRKQLNLSANKETDMSWFAAGISSVIHPLNPLVPTIHFNYRMFELYDSSSEGGGGEEALIDRWFGGGTDLTPYYLFDEDAVHFHQTYKNVCDEFDATLYPSFKKNCDDYFMNTHRNNERRGIGGIFYDYMREAQPPQTPPKEGLSKAQAQLMQHDNKLLTTLKSEVGAQVSFPLGRQGWAAFSEACGYAFIDAYIPIVQKRKNSPYTEAHKHWQEIRRGRYVEFNLIHDKGTMFGLKTNGRTESILMSLPPTVRFEYNYQPAPGSDEAKLLEVCLHPKDWV